MDQPNGSSSAPEDGPNMTQRIPDDLCSLSKAMRADSSVEVADRSRNMKKIEQCFPGNQAASWMLRKGYAVDSITSVMLGNILLRHGYITSVNEDNIFRNSSLDWYRFSESKLSGDEGVGNGTSTSGGKAGYDTESTTGNGEEEVGITPESISASISPEAAQKLYSETPEELCGMKEADETSAPFLLRCLHSAATSTLSLLGWPFALHVVATVRVGVVVCAFSKYPAGNFLALSPLIFGWLYCAERKTRMQNEKKIRNGIWRALTLANKKSNDAEYAAWFTRVLGSLWVGWLVPWLSRVLKRSVNPLLNDVKPAIFASLEIADFDLGRRGPNVKSVKCYDGQEEDMILELDIDLCTKDMNIVLAATLGGKYFGMPLKVFANDLCIAGPLRLGFKWMPVAPHVRYMTIGFLKVPEVSLKVKPLTSSGINVTDIPGLDGFLDRLIHSLLRDHMVEPQSIFCDLAPWWKGLEDETEMVYDIFEKWKAMYGDPRPKEKDGAEEDENSKGSFQADTAAIADIIICEGADLEIQRHDMKIDSYCRLVYGAKGRYKTKNMPTANPQWMEPMCIAIKDWASERTVLLEVYDHEGSARPMRRRAKTNARKDTFIGKVFIDLALYSTGEEFHDVWLPLHGASTGRIRLKICVTPGPGFEHIVVKDGARFSSQSLPGRANLDLPDLSNLSHATVAGFLFKRKVKKTHSNWKRRFFVLKSHEKSEEPPSLRYYTNKSCTDLKGEIEVSPSCIATQSLSRAQVEKEYGFKGPGSASHDAIFGIKLSEDGDIVLLCADTIRARDEWIQALDALRPLESKATSNIAVPAGKGNNSNNKSKFPMPHVPKVSLPHMPDFLKRNKRKVLSQSLLEEKQKESPESVDELFSGGGGDYGVEGRQECEDEIATAPSAEPRKTNIIGEERTGYLNTKAEDVVLPEQEEEVKRKSVKEMVTEIHYMSSTETTPEKTRSVGSANAASSHRYKPQVDNKEADTLGAEVSAGEGGPNFPEGLSPEGRERTSSKAKKLHATSRAREAAIRTKELVASRMKMKSKDKS